MQSQCHKGIMMEQTVEQTVEQQFIEEYNALCRLHGLQIAAQPNLVSTNHGSYEIVVQLMIVQLLQ